MAPFSSGFPSLRKFCVNQRKMGFPGLLRLSSVDHAQCKLSRLAIMFGDPRLASLLLLLLFLFSPAESHDQMPKEPKNRFCYTTTGGSARQGGEIVTGRCGESCSARGESEKQWIGWIGVVFAVLFLGSTYVVVKQFDSGDGMFFQWVLCIGIWQVGLVVNFIQSQPPFFLSSLIAGLLWSVGNVLVVPIIKMIGIALGMTIWSTTTLITGWVSGVFIFDQELRCAPLNYVGVIVILISACMLLLVRSDVKKRQVNSKPVNKSILDNSIDTLLRDKPKENKDWADKLGAWPRRILGCSAAIFAGCIFGGQFIPIEYLKLCDDPEHSCEDVDYMFGYYTGILSGSSIFLLVYTVFKTNRPWINHRLILPGIVAGIMWGIGSVGVFLANKYLSLAISIPFITTGGQFVSSAWGILVFKEITGWRQRLLFTAALAVGLCGLVMEGVSRCAVGCSIQLHNPS